VPREWSKVEGPNSKQLHILIKTSRSGIVDVDVATGMTNITNGENTKIDTVDNTGTLSRDKDRKVETNNLLEYDEIIVQQVVPNTSMIAALNEELVTQPSKVEIFADTASVFI
jgi:hypothetical protein